MQRILPEKLTPGRDYYILGRYYTTQPIRIGKFNTIEKLGGTTFARFTNVNSQTFEFQPISLFNINEYHFYLPSEEFMYDKVMTQKSWFLLDKTRWS